MKWNKLCVWNCTIDELRVLLCVGVDTHICVCFSFILFRLCFFVSSHKIPSFVVVGRLLLTIVCASVRVYVCVFVWHKTETKKKNCWLVAFSFHIFCFVFPLLFVIQRNQFGYNSLQLLCLHVIFSKLIPFFFGIIFSIV